MFHKIQLGIIYQQTFLAALNCGGGDTFKSDNFLFSHRNDKFYHLSAAAVDFPYGLQACQGLDAMLAEFRTEDDWNSILNITGCNSNSSETLCAIHDPMQRHDFLINPVL